MKTGGEVLVDSLLLNGASIGFGVPGESYLALLDALVDVEDRFELMTTRNEGGAAFMAAASGALTGQPGLCFVTRGPGATNASCGIHSAMQNGSPMILFIGQVERGHRGRDAFQEVDYRDFFGSMTKWVAEFDSPDRIPELVSRAFKTAMSGRPGPVVLSMPEDVLAATTAATAFAAPRIHPPAASEAGVSAIHTQLQRAQKPLLLVGGCGWSTEAQQTLLDLAREMAVPVATEFRFNDLFDNHDAHYVGDAGVGMAAGVQRLLRETDCLVSLGASLGDMMTASYTLLDLPKPEAALVHVHRGEDELGKVYAADLAVQADPGAVAAQLLAQHRQLASAGSSANGASNNSPATEPRAQWLTQARQDYLEALEAKTQPGNVDMAAICVWLRENLPDDVIVCNGAGNFTAWPNRYLQYGSNARLLAPQSGAMGYGLPAAIAAKKIHPERMVICITGDGDFQMNCQELGAALQAGAQPVILLLNNSSYGTIRMHQEKYYPNRRSATDIVNPDFPALAAAYGFVSERVDATADFAAAFKRVCDAPGGGLLELVTSIDALSAASTLDEIRGSGVT